MFIYMDLNIGNNSDNNIMDNRTFHNPHANGRVNIQAPNMNQFELFANPGVDYNDVTSYRGAMTGNWNDTALSNAFFSRENIQIIQNGIRAGVYRMSNGRYTVGPQDETNLKIIMRSIFLQFSRNLNSDIPGQIKALDDKVLEYCVPEVHNEAISYIKFKHDVSTLPVPEARPTLASNKGEKTLELKPWF
jgi:hypothetical protein